MMKKRKNKKHRINKSRLGVLAITIVVVMLCIVMTFQILNLRKSNKALEEKKASLEEVLDQENKRTQELDSEKEYVQTKKYVEEVAKTLGYIYPNEIIFKPEMK